MMIVWAGSLFPPAGAAGAEFTALEALLAWKRAGHDVVYWRHGLRTPYEYEGVPVQRQPPRHANVVIGHLNHAVDVHRYAARASAGVVWMAHAANQLGTGGRCAAYIANSLHVQRRMPSAWLMRPHVPVWRYAQGQTGTCVTLVNLSRWKGAGVFGELVKARPDLRFLGVRGAWDAQEWRAGRYENLTVWETQPRIQAVLAATRVLVMPSESESWGRVGVEAACRGIPTVAHPCVGIKESLGDAALYADRRSVVEWSAAVDEALAKHQRLGGVARRRAAHLERVTALDQVRVLALLKERFG